MAGEMSDKSRIVIPIGTIGALIIALALWLNRAIADLGERVTRVEAVLSVKLETAILGRAEIEAMIEARAPWNRDKADVLSRLASVEREVQRVKERCDEAHAAEQKNGGNK